MVVIGLVLVGVAILAGRLRMNLQGAVLAAALASIVSVSLGGTETNVRMEVADETAETEWECSLSISTYLAQHARDYANPNFTADRDWLHPRSPL